jgi:hypothetical protein
LGPITKSQYASNEQNHAVTCLIAAILRSSIPESNKKCSEMA